jgi:AraC-like DNA-binding protein
MAEHDKHKRLTLSQCRRAIVMRHAGHSVASIAAAVGCSARTVSRLCSRFGVRRADFRKEAIERARADLLNDSTFTDALKSDLRALALDTAAQARALRDKISVTLEHIQPSDLESAAVASRALAALATSLKVTADTLKSLEVATVSAEELPELTVAVMDQAEIDEVKRENMGDDYDGEEMGGDALAELFDDDDG